MLLSVEPFTRWESNAKINSSESSRQLSENARILSVFPLRPMLVDPACVLRALHSESVTHGPFRVRRAALGKTHPVITRQLDRFRVRLTALLDSVGANAWPHRVQGV